jgi:hypothetical protein
MQKCGGQRLVRFYEIRNTTMQRKWMASLAFKFALAMFIAVVVGLVPTQRQSAFAQSAHYSVQEIIDAGHGFFGNTSGGLAMVIQNAFEQHGLPNGYILGQEGSGAVIAGLTYGEGQLHTKNAGNHTVFWQGPSLGLDYGGQGSRTMMLVYNLPSVEALYTRFGGISGSAYVVAGASMTVLKNRNMILVPVHTGIGARLGVNIGYLKLTDKPTWNPF